MSFRSCWFPIALMLSWLAPVLTGSTTWAQSRDEKVRQDRTNVIGSGLWIYDDLGAGRLEARQFGKPLMVVLRCIP